MKRILIQKLPDNTPIEFIVKLHSNLVLSTPNNVNVKTEFKIS